MATQISESQAFEITAKNIENKKDVSINNIKCLNQSQRKFLINFMKNFNYEYIPQKDANTYYQEICPILEAKTVKTTFEHNFVLFFQKLFAKFCCCSYDYTSSEEVKRALYDFYQQRLFKELKEKRIS